MKPITVLLAEDHVIVRQGLRVLVEADGDISVIGEAKTGREAVQKYREYLPDVVVMDIAMPLLNGLGGTKQILKAHPNARILILSAHSDFAYVEQVVLAGAMGYLVKQSSGDILAKAIRELHKGKKFFSPKIERQLKEGFQKTENGVGLSKKSDHKLTSREGELLQLIAEGHANKQIASELGISIKTVEKHRQNLMQKLNIHDIAGLTRFAISSGVVESSTQSTFEIET